MLVHRLRRWPNITPTHVQNRPLLNLFLMSPILFTNYFVLKFIVLGCRPSSQNILNLLAYSYSCWKWCVNPYPVQLIYLNFQALEIVSRYRDPQSQVTITHIQYI